MAGCGEQPAGGRRPNMDKESAHQGPESLADHSAAPPKKNPEYLLKEIKVCKQRIFTKVQVNILEALFKKKQFISLSEREQLGNYLSVQPHSIKVWFKNRRAKGRNLALISQPESVCGWSLDSETLTQDQQDFPQKQKMDGTINVVQAQKRSFLDMFPPPQPMDSYALPQEPHSSGMVYYQNVGGPPDSRCGTEVCKMLPENSHRPSNTYLFSLSTPKKNIKPGTSIWTPVPPVTIDLRSFDGPSTSSAPSTSQMPIAQDNADAGSSPDPASPLIDVEATDSD
ncbi:homeobox protein Mix.1-like [Eleutherodactylus coqui]|uniref:homeobox protein Mix.1-like n=1 Tax=Eleutherodactylus coqui TaxID=57060 RepID=UPI0034624535